MKVDKVTYKVTIELEMAKPSERGREEIERAVEELSKDIQHLRPRVTVTIAVGHELEPDF